MTVEKLERGNNMRQIIFSLEQGYEIKEITVDDYDF